MVIQSQEPYGRVFPTSRYESAPLICPYKCSDGEWIILAVMNYKKDRDSLYTALGIENLLQDERYNSMSGLVKNRSTFIKILEDRFAVKSSAEWSEILKKHDIVFSILGHMKNVAKDEQAWVNQYLHDYTCESGTKVAMPCGPIKSDRAGIP
jgi:crotonobetainyl-CoA:carnitine CoA-transferase CaiB-like acyl-CoA transferase